MSYTLVDETLETQLADPEARKQWLVLDQHPDFPGHWIVEGFCNDYRFDLGGILGSYRALAPAGLGRFLETTEAHGYQVAFFDDPTAPLEAYAGLNAVPEVEVNSTFENTVNGMLPYQVQGFNLLKDLDYGVARWDTGTGKTVLACALAKYLGECEICFFVVKKNNKVNTARKLKSLVGIDALYISGAQQKRHERYHEMRHWLNKGARGLMVVLNYEQFRNDFVHRNDEDLLELTEWGEAFFSNRDLMIVWDEMPTKLSNRTTELYKSVCKCLYRTAPPQVKWEQLRPRSLRSYMLSATPIENSPEGWFNCVRLLDGGQTYGTVTDFNSMYVKSWNSYDPTKPETFHNFERMRLKTARFVHQASKADPDIAAVFPKAIEEVVYVDWDEHHASIYNEIQDLAANLVADEEFRNVPIFSLIGTLQMVCDAPEMINDSAARREAYVDALAEYEYNPIGQPPRVDGSDFARNLPEKLLARLSNQGHPKLERLRELLERHPDAQAVLYTRFNQALMPYIEAALQDWGIRYGRYDGSERRQQAVQDAFQAGESRVFLTSDKGSDSLDLDAGSVVIDYDLPWKWTTLTQRHNRVHRPTSSHETVYYYSLLMEGSVEERVLQIIERKHGFHTELFDPAAGDASASARMTKDELMWILTGRSKVC